MYELNTTFILHENKGLFPWHAFLIPAGYFIMTYANIWLQFDFVMSLFIVYSCVCKRFPCYTKPMIFLFSNWCTLYLSLFFLPVTWGTSTILILVWRARCRWHDKALLLLTEPVCFTLMKYHSFHVCCHLPNTHTHTHTLSDSFMLYSFMLTHSFEDISMFTVRCMNIG